MDSYDYGQSVKIKGGLTHTIRKRSADAYHAGIGFIIAEAGKLRSLFPLIQEALMEK